tara:strand:- start:3664 stop:3846 length:183 start_codon:yes stop_codon:yes gene_type:complete
VLVFLKKEIIKIVLVLLFSIFVVSCNTVVGTAKGVARDVKATSVYTRDALTGRPISDKSD